MRGLRFGPVTLLVYTSSSRCCACHPRTDAHACSITRGMTPRDRTAWQHHPGNRRSWGVWGAHGLGDGKRATFSASSPLSAAPDCCILANMALRCRLAQVHNRVGVQSWNSVHPPDKGGPYSRAMFVYALRSPSTMHIVSRFLTAEGRWQDCIAVPPTRRRPTFTPVRGGACITITPGTHRLPSFRTRRILCSILWGGHGWRAGSDTFGGRRVAVVGPLTDARGE